MTKSVFTGPVYVVRDNIDTDQMISAQYLNLVPTIPEEYEKLGSYALAACPNPFTRPATSAPASSTANIPLSWAGAIRLRQFARARAHRAWSAGCKVVLRKASRASFSAIASPRRTLSV